MFTVRNSHAVQISDKSTQVLSATLCMDMQAYEERVSALRMARLEAEWKAAERARRVRAAAQQEQALRQAFLDVS